MAALDPTDIDTLAQLAAALDQLRGNRSLRSLDKAAKELPRRPGRTSALPTSTVSDVFNGKSVPSVDTLVALLEVCGISDEPAQRMWLKARDRVEHRHHRRPPGAVRVRDARPRVLGVHAAIQTDPAQRSAQSVAGQEQAELPLYVPRDLDADLHTKITVAGRRGGFVLLVGGSSVGKTRALFEALRAVVPDWWLLHPAGAAAVREFAPAPTVRTVVWLDELQRYLDHPTGLPAAIIRDLVGAGVVVVATMWPGEYGMRTAPRTDGQPDPYVNDSELLGIAEVVDVPETFSPHERSRAEDLAAADSRIRVALDTDAGFTQVMAAGPELIRHWKQAPADQCYGKAVITAALDARRVGAQAPLTRAYLDAAAPGYLTDRQQATAPPDWLDRALAYATTLLHGATATLTPTPADMGRIAGYQVADYLHQHALRVRRTTHLPHTTWHALVQHHHPDDTDRLANNASGRSRDHEAEILYRQLVNRGDKTAHYRLADLLVKQGRVDEEIALYRAVADNGDPYAADRLAELLAKHGRVDELTHRADNGHQDAANRLADLLVGQGRVDELTRRADNGDPFAADRLAELLAKRGRVDDLTHRAENGDGFAADRLAELLAEQGRVDELTHRADNGDPFATFSLVDLLIERGQVDEALNRLRTLADNGDTYATRRLLDRLAEQGQVDEALNRLRTLADNGDTYATRRLAIRLAEQGQVDELTRRAENGDGFAARWLAIRLAEHGRVDELTRRADNGHQDAADRLAELLAEQGRVDELTHRADDDAPYTAHRLVDLLAEQGRIDDALARLRTLANNGHAYAANRLADLLIGHGRVDELTRRADDGDQPATFSLVNLLIERGQVDDALNRLRTLADNGDSSAGHRLASLLAKHGRIDQLDAEVAAGTSGAIEALRSVRSEHPADTPNQTTEPRSHDPRVTD
jgi:predicted negative regulator of RcsB-dependent stress response